jgi:neutral ceramidase
VNKEFTMLRVDRVADGGTIPLGAFTNFAIHGTAIGVDNDLYNADCFGAAERYFEEAVRDSHSVPESVPVIHALTVGMAGDVGPKFDRTKRGFDESRRLGRMIAEKAFALFQSLGDSLSDNLEIGRAYREISMRHVVSSRDGAELQPPTLGFPVLGGTEDGYSPLHYLWPGAEGSRAKSSDFTLGPVGVSLLLGPLSWNGGDSAKMAAAGGFHDHLLRPEGYPELLTLQAFRLGDLCLLALPGEITTEMGQRIVDSCGPLARSLFGSKRTMIVSLANLYVAYITTPEEYNAQHYEGAHTLWGAHLGGFVTGELAELVQEIDQNKEYSLPEKWTFEPGSYYRFAGYDFPEPAPVGIDTVFVDSTHGGRWVARHYWWDDNPSELDLGRLDWRIEVPDDDGNWATLQSPGIHDRSTI